MRAYLKNRDRTINVGMIGRVSSEDRRVMGGPGAWPRKKISHLRSSNCWKCIEIDNPTITTLFCIISNLLRSHQADAFGSGETHAYHAHLRCLLVGLLHVELI